MDLLTSDSDSRKPVVVLPYDPLWVEEFEKIYASIWPSIQSLAERIEHIGSTAVPGLAAKPIIDMDIVIADDQQFTAVKTALESLGYWHNGNQGILGREAFKYNPAQKLDLMPHHLYVCSADSTELKRHLTLRDHLRNYPVDRDAYAMVKFSAAQAHPDDIDGYIETKSPFISSILEQYELNKPLSVVANTYALCPEAIEAVQGGWSADAFHVKAVEGEFFLKVYDKTRPSVAAFIRAMADYLPVLRKLNQDPELMRHLPVVVSTHNGALYSEDRNHVYLLTQYIHGQTLGEESPSETQVDQLADVLARLHSYRAELLPGYKLSKEKFQFDLSAELHFLRADRRQEQPTGLRDIFLMNKALLDQALNKINQLADELKSINHTLCLVHADLHPGNLMWTGDKLVVLDLEDLTYSLPELDLMFLVDQPYSSRFFARYQRLHPNYQINWTAINYFWLRRDLTDIVQFGRQIAYENLDETTQKHAFHWMATNIANLKFWLQR